MGRRCPAGLKGLAVEIYIRQRWRWKSDHCLWNTRGMERFSFEWSHVSSRIRYIGEFSGVFRLKFKFLNFTPFTMVSFEWTLGLIFSASQLLFHKWISSQLCIVSESPSVQKGKYILQISQAFVFLKLVTNTRANKSTKQARTPTKKESGATWRAP